MGIRSDTFLRALRHRATVGWFAGITLVFALNCSLALSHDAIGRRFPLVAFALWYVSFLFFTFLANYRLVTGRWNLLTWYRVCVVVVFFVFQASLGVFNAFMGRYWLLAAVVYFCGSLSFIGQVGYRVLIGSLFAYFVPFYLSLANLDPEFLRADLGANVAGSAVLSIFLMFVGSVSTMFKKQGADVRALLRSSRRAKRTIAEEREKSEKLLLNILPAEVAQELKEKGGIEPVHYDSASVLFTDFKGFTKIAESLSPKELVGELDRCFSYFDALTKKYNLEKIKTIGDSYMLCGGVPAQNRTHAIDCVLAALEIQAFMNQMKELKKGRGNPYWELRLGISTGPLVAGVIGEMKFAFDVFGDTVNTASRAESSGAVGRINITGATYSQAKDYFECEHRGTVAAKNKGEIDMYFVNGIRPELSRDGDGRVPGLTFGRMYKRLEAS